MLKYTVLLAAVLSLVSSQRPWHAGSSNRLPMVLPQYIDERLAAEQTNQAAEAGQTVQPDIAVQSAPIQPMQGAQGATASASADAGISNRIDGSGVNNVITARPAILSTTFATTTINPADLPVDAHGDVDLVNRIKTWPREKQPFWYLNWQAIQAHRGDANNNAQVPQVQPNPRSFFAG